MPQHVPETPRSLPDRPNLRHLKDQAWDLLKAGKVDSLTEAQFRIALEYGFASWPRLKEHVDSLEEVGKLKHAIDTNDFIGMRTLMTRNPDLHRAPLGYGKNGPLTWVAECRIPWEAPGATRLAMAQWMIDHGSDVHQGGDGPLMRAALVDRRIPMMDLLVRNGADVNAEWGGHFPILFAPCETVEPLALKWLLDHGADPYLPERRGHESPLDYVIGTYSRSARLSQCIDILVSAGCATRRRVPGMLDLLRGRLDLVAVQLDADRSLVHRRFPEFDFGSSGSRRLKLNGATLLHLAAEYGNLKAAQLLVACGADINARSEVDEAGVGGQTPIFHAVTQFQDYGLAMTKYMVESGADLSVRARLPGHYERPDEFVECTPLGYARLFPGNDNATVEFLHSVGAAE